MAEEATAAGRSLAQESEQLASLVGQFRLGNVAELEPARRAKVERAAAEAAHKADTQAPRRQLKTPASRNGSALRKPEPGEEEWQDF
jgi:hypothetical protein